MNTFLESYDSSEKTILPFGTSHSRGLEVLLLIWRNVR
ncbi:hypothetical protein LIZ64_16275 [[Clostridium] hylemonae]|nr:hypothetical protein [[Clostridium] hylemonae]